MADREEGALWRPGGEGMVNKLKDVDIVLSAGDLSAYYLEYLADNIKAPVVFVPGNHDSGYTQRPPNKCVNTDGQITEFRMIRGNEMNYVRIIGLGGSMRYKKGPYQFTEEEQSCRMQKLAEIVREEKLIKYKRMDILLTHAPCRGYGDMQDMPHKGFDCFNEFLYEFKPKLHCYGHIHEGYRSINPEYEEEGYHRLIKHPSGTSLVNGFGYCFITIE